MIAKQTEDACMRYYLRFEVLFLELFADSRGRENSFLFPFLVSGQFFEKIAEHELTRLHDATERCFCLIDFTISIVVLPNQCLCEVMIYLGEFLSDVCFGGW